MSNWKNMEAPNLGLLFYKRIYNEANLLKKLQVKNQELIFNVYKKNSEFNDFYNDLYSNNINAYTFNTECKGNSSFSLYTTYPGLLTGSGYAHDTKSIGDAKMGFFFDHTTGLPIIPGSSVKGVLHSLFEADVFEADENENSKNYTGEKSTAVIQYLLQDIANKDRNVSEVTREKVSVAAATLTPASLRSIKNQIFGSGENPGTDVFFDAVIDTEISGNRMFIGDDFLTPHYRDLLKDPQPLQFLKVLPNIPFKFEFKLSDLGFAPEIKELLFRKIILTIGLGAKTNVGYGQFSLTPLPENTTVQYQPPPTKQHANSPHKDVRYDRQRNEDLLEERRYESSRQAHKEAFFVEIPAGAPVESTLKFNDIIEVVVLYSTEEDDTNVIVKLMVQEGSTIPIPKPDKCAEYTAGERFFLVIKDIREKKVKGGSRQKK